MTFDLTRGAFGPLLRHHRLAARLSQEQLAEKAHLSVDGLSALERGRRRAPYRDTIALLCAALDLSPEQRIELELAAGRYRPAGDDGAPLESLGDVEPDEPHAPAALERRHHLPRPLTSFVGRTDDAAAVRALCAAHPLVSVVGPGGIGKTRLAVEVAWQLVDAYADGVWFVDLAALTESGDVEGTLVAALSIVLREGESPAQALAAYLKRRQLLLVIDNCEHVVRDLAALLVRLLPACPQVAVLATSREPLHIGGEYPYRLAPLSVPPAGAAVASHDAARYSAVALFVERARAANAAFPSNDATIGGIARLCRRLDGIALAIELAASRVAAFNVHEICAQLDDQFSRSWPSQRAVQPRQQTMREAIRWSYDRLSAPERAVFHASAVFPSGHSWEGLRGMLQATGTDPGELAATLAALVDKSLITADISERVTRYRVLEPMRDFSLEVVTQQDRRADYERAFVRWCHRFVCDADAYWAHESSAAWSARVEPELDNLRAAVHWTLFEGRDAELGQRIVAHGRRIWARLLPSEANGWLAAALRRIAPHSPPDLVAALWLTQAHLRVSLQRYAGVVDAVAACEPFFARAKNESALAEARGYAALAQLFAGEAGPARATLAASLHTFERLGAKQLAAYAMTDLGIAALIEHDLPESRRCLRAALGRFRELDNERGMSAVAGNLAEIEFQTGAPERAIRFCQEALALSSSGREARVYLANLSGYLVAVRRFDEARVAARRSLLVPGGARGDVDIADPLQHLAAVAVYGGSRSSGRREALLCAAELLGFVDRWLHLTSKMRHVAEQTEYERLIDLLKAELGLQTFAEYYAAGESLTEEDVIAEALRV